MIAEALNLDEDQNTGEAAEVLSSRDFERFLKRHGFSRRMAKRITLKGYVDPEVTAAIAIETARATLSLKRLQALLAEAAPNPEGQDDE